MHEQLRRIQLVTQYYDWLQGLRFLPLGVLMVVVGGALGVLPTEGGRPPRSWPVVLAASLTVGFLLYAVLGAYYRRRFGDVRPSEATKQTRRRMVLTFLLAGLGLSQLLVLVNMKGSGKPLPVALALSLGAASLVAYWAWMGRFVKHYPLVAGGMLVLAGLHHLGLNPLCAHFHPGTSAPDFRCDMATFHIVWGLAIIAMSVLDHRMLVRTLRPPVAEEEDEASPEAAG